VLLFFRGTSGIDIDLQKVDINQCESPAGSTEPNVFANSSRCEPITTKVGINAILLTDPTKLQQDRVEEDKTMQK